ncbi:hypothetical protein [Sphingomonas bacterium]|uniref:hypothetical protein n=1 Tax=Sphingomonas bacterium TaxID=1895847 RepID=UPI001577616C|nr:hypothetical protein [Sphingomonas bacterium]
MSTKWAMLAWAGPGLLLVAAAPAERTVEVNTLVPITVQGVPGRMRIDPGAPGHPLLTPEYAAKAGLKGGGMLGFDVIYHVGNQTIHGRTQTAKFGLNGVFQNQRVIWTARPYAAGIDAVIGPAGIPASIIRFALHPALPSERTIALPMAGGTGMFASWESLSGQIMVGGAPMRVRFDPNHPLTIANAGAAERLARAFDGRLTGATGSAEIAFGIARPVRGMTLARPVTIGPLSLPALHVRVADGSIAAIPDANAPPPDPDEIVVTARRKHDPSNDRITLGADTLARCSAIVFDKAARQVRLTCA